MASINVVAFRYLKRLQLYLSIDLMLKKIITVVFIVHLENVCYYLFNFITAAPRLTAT